MALQETVVNVKRRCTTIVPMTWSNPLISSILMGCQLQIFLTELAIAVQIAIAFLQVEELLQIKGKVQGFPKIQGSPHIRRQESVKGQRASRSE
jgi:hypothetical protein